MNCRSCRAKLSARDDKCPSCGRNNPGSRDLGSGSASSSDLTSRSPLPPVRSWEPAPASDEKGPRTEPPAKRPARRDPDEPLRLTEVARDGGPRETTRGNGSSRSGGASAAPGRGEVRAMIAERPQLVEGGLRIHTEDGAPKGVGFPTPVGEIDLLARDRASGWVLIVIPDESREKELMSELLQLMGWVRKHLGEPGQEVRAIALLDWVPDDLGYAAAALADSVEFKRYQLSLTFEPLDL